MKGKVTMTISVGCTAFILTMIMFTQFKTVDETDITAIETMRETELRTELASWKDKYEEIETKIEDTENKISEYKQEINTNANESAILESEVKEAESYLGYTSLKGQGIEVTLKDNDTYNIDYSDLLSLVNELNIAGAEAISINDERIVAMSDITLINNRIMVINDKRIAGPYIVKAIGDKKYFESALTIKGGYIDKIKAEQKDIDYDISDNVIIPAYDINNNNKQNLEYSKEYTENK